MNEMTVPTRYEHALSEALRAALGERCEIDDVAHCGANEATPMVQFVVTAADRDITDTGFGEVFFVEDRACNDNGWCEGDAVLLLATQVGPAVLELCHGCPEYCDDETDASMSGTATFFDDVGVAARLCHAPRRPDALFLLQERDGDCPATRVSRRCRPRGTGTDGRRPKPGARRARFAARWLARELLRRPGASLSAAATGASS